MTATGQDGSSLVSREGLEGIEGDFEMDMTVLDAMPKGVKIKSAVPYGHSPFTSTGCVSVMLPDGTPEKYFLKCATQETGRVMLFGEYTSIYLMDSLFPGICPKPLGWGQYSKKDPIKFFLLSNFIDLSTEPPNPEKLASRLAALHHEGLSSNGKFGFPVVTYNGALGHTVDWEENWAKFFTTMLKAGLDYDASVNGPWEDLSDVASKVIEKVIPRLLGVLQSDGRSIAPSLLHGDLWSGNIGTDKETGEIVFYDVGSYYAHNEMELGSWRCPWSQKPENAKIYIEKYLKHFPPAEPAEEFEDRNRLYSCKFNLGFSGGHPGAASRQIVYEDMCFLYQKYGS